MSQRRQIIGRENDPSKEKQGPPPGKAIAMAICPIICSFYYLAHARSCMTWRVNERAQKQFLRTQIHTPRHAGTRALSNQVNK